MSPGNSGQACKPGTPSTRMMHTVNTADHFVFDVCISVMYACGCASPLQPLSMSPVGIIMSCAYVNLIASNLQDHMCEIHPLFLVLY